MGRIRKDGRLTLKQELWWQHYLDTGNGSEAYRRAYNCEGMSPHTIGVEASRLLNHPVIIERSKDRVARWERERLIKAAIKEKLYDDEREAARERRRTICRAASAAGYERWRNGHAKALG
jgi:phage terminase small subunit